MATPNVSVVMSKVSVKFGRARVKRCVMDCFRDAKDFVALSV